MVGEFSSGLLKQVNALLVDTERDLKPSVAEKKTGQIVKRTRLANPSSICFSPNNQIDLRCVVMSTAFQSCSLSVKEPENLHRQRILPKNEYPNVNLSSQRKVNGKPSAQVFPDSQRNTQWGQVRRSMWNSLGVSPS